MLRNYLSVALRSFLRSKLQSSLNVLGLTIGFASAIAILVYVQFELSYDSFHPDADRTYRILRDREGDNSVTTPGTSTALAPAAMKEIPDVEVSTRWHTWTSNWARRPGEAVTKPARPVAWVDANFFKVFGFEIVYGDPKTMFQDVRSVVISTDASALFFGDENPIGQILVLENAGRAGDYTVTGVFSRPKTSSLLFNFCLPADPEWWEVGRWEPQGGGGMGAHTFVKLRPGASPQRVTDLLHDLMERHMGAEIRATDRYRLQPIKDIHLYTDAKFRPSLQNRRVQHGDPQTVYTLVAIAFLILLIAGANFTNLAMSQSVQRTREVGMRKVSGGSRSQIVFQFVGEALLMAMVSMALAVGIVVIVLPEFAAIVHRFLSRPRMGGCLCVARHCRGHRYDSRLSACLVSGIPRSSHLVEGIPVRILLGWCLHEGAHHPAVRHFRVSCRGIGGRLPAAATHAAVRHRLQRKLPHPVTPFRSGGKKIRLVQAACPPPRRCKACFSGSSSHFLRDGLLYTDG